MAEWLSGQVVEGLGGREVGGQPAARGEPDLSSYAGRWVAIVQGRVAGVGRTAEEARRLAKRNRPKEEPRVLFVPEGERP